jgi:hypothetical protein
VWIDGGWTVAGDFWPGGLLIRPGKEFGFACAEEVLRSGGFALVVLTGSGGLGRVASRLSRAVREGGSAFVVRSEESLLAHLRVASRLLVAGASWKQDPFGEPAVVEAVRVRVEARALGWSGSIEFLLPVLCRSPRLAVDPMLVDRRGVRAGWRLRPRPPFSLWSQSLERRDVSCEPWQAEVAERSAGS